MSFSLTSARARQNAMRTWAVALAAVLALSMVTFVSAPAEAVQSTGGAARFPYVQWISWGANGANLIPDANGRITRTETVNVGGQQIVVACTITNLAQTRASTTTAPLIRAYASGQWRGDGLDELYNIGGTGTNNSLAVGIRSVNDAASVTFDFACSAELVVGSTRTPVTLAGLVLASAESSASGSGPQGDTWERIGATIPATGTWRILDYVRGSACTQDNYARLTGGTGPKTLMLYGAKTGTCEGTGANVTPNPTTVAYMEGVSSATNVTLYGNGYEAVALGFVVNTEFGDAPASYGVAGALSQGGFSGGVPNAYTSGDGQAVSTMTYAQASSPVLRLGSSLDFETNHQPSSAANADDTTGSDDEDGVTLSSSYTATVGSTVTVSGIQCNATTGQPGFVAGWIDFNADGVFQASEKSTTVACPTGGGTVSVAFTAPNTAPRLALQPSFARFRIAPTSAELTATGIVSGGEVEDYPITVSWPRLPAMTLDKVQTGGTFATGSTLTYSLQVTNTGNTPLTSVAITDPTATVSGCTWATLAVDATVTCTATRVVTAADFSSGSYTNTASVVARDPGNAVVGPVTDSVTVRRVATASNDSDSTTAGVAITRNAANGVLVNDSGHLLTVTSHVALNPAVGTLSIAANGSYVFTPAAGFSGTASSVYTATDGFGNTVTATLTIIVSPVANPDSGTTAAGTPITLTQASLINDDLGSSLQVISVTQPANGTAVRNAGGSVTYTPNAGFSGTNTFTYTVQDSAGRSATSTVTITVTPSAGPDSGTTPAGTPITWTETQLINDDAGTALDVLSITQPSNGVAVLNGDDSVTYTPNAGFSGTDTYTYTVTDSFGQLATATVTVTVTPTAGPDAGSTPAETPVTLTQAQLTNDDVGTSLDVVAVTQPANGTAVLNFDGSVTYTPDDDFSGTNTYTYTAEDASGQQVTATVTITVTPTAGPDTATTAAGIPVTLTEAELTNDDLGSSLNVIAVSQPSHGSTVLNGDGSVTYTPNTGFSGTDTYTYTVEDAAGQEVTATVTITVGPAAGPDSGTTPAETPISWTQAELINDDAGTGLEVVSATNGSNGIVTVNMTTGEVTYTPNDGFSGPDTFTYTVEDAEGQPVSATVTVTVTPTAGPNSGITPAETPFTWTESTLLLNDVGAALEVLSVIQPGDGTAMVNGDGSVTYTPDDGFSGTDSFTYMVEDSDGQQVSATISVTVTPTAGPDSASTASGTPVTLTGAELTDDDLGSSLDVVAITQPSNGSAVLNGDGSVTYAPGAGFSGTDSYTYTVEDAEGQQVTATVTITVGPVAGPDSGTTPAETPVSWTQAELINDDQGADLEVISATNGSNGIVMVNVTTGAVTYTPNDGFSGTDSFAYTVEDSAGQQATATVTVTVTPTAGPDSGTTPAETPVSWTEAELTSDDLGSGLEVLNTTDGANGTTVINGDGSVTYTPNAGFSGTDSFTYTVADNEGQEVSATVTVTVTPSAAPDSGTTPAETPIDWTRTDLINDDRGTSLDVVDVTDGANGTTVINGDGSVTYTPDAGFSGTDTFTYTVEDAEGQEATATVTVTVTPTAGPDSGTTPAETPIDWTRTDLINDDRGTSLDVVDVTDGANGTTVINGDGSVTYTPNAGFSGTDTFTYTVEDAEGQEVAATVTVTVTPTAGPDSGSTPTETPVTWTRTELINDDRGTSLDVVDVTDGANGTTVINGDGSVTYTPNDGFSGTDSFTYTVEDAEGQEVTATVTVLVTPTAGPDSGTTPAETAISWTQTELINDDLGSGLEVDSATNGANGIVTVNATTGEVTYTPNDGFSGTDTFTYTVEDNEGQLVSATVTVTVTPTAGPDSDTTPAETPVTLAEAELINDDLGSDLSVVDATDGLHGAILLNGDGSVTYTPDAGFSGTDTFTYTVEDGDGQEATATVTILVTPTAGPDSGTTLAETPISWTQAELINDDRGSGLEVYSATNGTNGIVTVNATSGEVTYTPNADFSGTDTFTYTVEDNEGQLVSATVTVTVTPVAVDDTDSTLVDVDITRNAANGVLPDDLGSSLTVVSHDTLPSSQGVLTINADGSYTFEPATGYSGVVVAGYTVEDAEGRTAAATLTIVVGPGALDDADATDVNTPITRAAGAGVLTNDAGTGLTVTGYDTIPAAQGTLVINSDGGYTFTPATNFSGIVTTVYTGEDEDGLPVTATLTIDVRPAAGDDNDVTEVNIAITRDAADGVLDNDLGTSLTVTGHDAVAAAQGTLVIEADGGYTFTPAADFSGTVTAGYTAEDDDGLTVTATLTILVTPSAEDDIDATGVNVTITRGSGEGVLVNDNGSSLEVTGHDAIPVAQGTLVIDADGGYTFAPAAGFSGIATAGYMAADAEGQEVTATLTISVAPSAADDTDSTDVNVPITRGSGEGVLANDNGTSLVVTGHDTIPAAQGVLVINADGGYTFTPTVGFSGTVTAAYTVEDGEGQAVTATLTITVAPIAADDTDSTDVNVAITRGAADGVLDNDNGSSLVVTGHDTIPAAQGVLTISADGGYTFAPATNFSGTVTADYAAEDTEGQQVTATLTITVAPSATDDTDSTDVNVAITRDAADGVLDNDNGTSLTVVDYDTIPAAQGVLTISANGGYTYTPATDFSGTITAEYTVEDAEGQEATATLTITVAPSADDDSDSTDVNVAITRDAADGVLDNDHGSSLVVTGHDMLPAAQGVLVIDGDGGYTLTPATDFSGTVTADYTAEDADGQEVTATLTIVVAPSATDDTDSTAVNVAITRDAADGVLDNDNGSSLVVTGHDTIPASQGVLTISADGGFTFTPATDFSGTVAADYTAEDAEGQEVTATLTIVVAPSATDDSDSTDVNVAITRDADGGVLDNDNGSSLVVTGHDTIPASQGVLTISADGGYTFTPATNFSGTVAAGYTAEDAEGQEAAATLTIVVAPSAGDDTDTTGVDVPISRNAAAGVLINDHGSSLSVTGHDTVPASQGLLTINWDGSYSFTPAAGFSGTVTADYAIEDGEDQATTATLTITVVPTAADDTDVTGVNVAITRDAAEGVLGNDNGSSLEVTGYATIPTAQGVLTINADGSYAFTPAADFSGTVTADYTAEDAEGQEVTATLTITVAPSADDDTDSTDVNVPISRDTAVGVFANDHGSSLEVTGYDTIPAAQGVLVINADGGYTFTPAAEFSGIVTADYTAEDAEGQEITATLTITVAPSAGNDADSTDVNVPLTRDAVDGVLINDHGTLLEVTGHDAIPVAEGTLVINADGSYAFTPATDFSGTVVSEYTAQDADGLTVTATLSIVVAPSATDDTDITAAGVAITRNAADGVLDNDNGSSLAIVGHDAIPAAQGTLVINSHGGYTFTPADGFSGTVTADYTAEDPEGQEVTATVTITVTPVANPDSGTTPAETPISWSQGSLINDDLGTTLTVVSAAGGANGLVSLDGLTGDVTYTPNDGFSGTDTFTYTVEDAEGQSATATVTVTVTPVASDESDSTNVNVAITRNAAAGVLVNDLGSSLEVADHDTIPVSVGTLVINTDGGYTFTPATDFSGTVTADYTAEDAEGQEATATLTIVVAPAANDDVDSTSVGVAITRDAGNGVLNNDHGSSLEVTGHDSIPGAQGTLAIAADGGYTFTPAAGFSGTVTTDYTAEDVEGQEITATLTITVTPEANPDSGTTEAETPITWTQTELTDDDSGSELQTVSATNGSNGVVTVNLTTGAVTYTPNEGFSGTDTFAYTVEDAEGQPATATVTVTVTPLAVDDAHSTDVNVAITRDAAAGVLPNDLGSSLVVTGHDTIPAVQGVLAIDADGGYTFTPATDFSGTVTADYTAEDAEGQETTATLTIVVTPSATDDFYSTDVNTVITRDASDGVLDNDNGSSLEVTGYDTIPAAQGTLVIDADGGYTFTPAPNFSGTVTADYTAEDAEGQMVTATLTIVVGVAALDDFDATAVNTAISRDAAAGVLINDGGSGLTVTGHDTILAAQGTLVINADGGYAFTPAANFSGTVTADYTAEDAEGQAVTATLTITVTPEANPDSGTTEAETAITWNQAELINDDAGSGLTTASATNGANGIVMVNSTTGDVTYVPNDGFSGTDTFTYTVEDAEGQPATATVTVTVTPVAINDSDATDVNVAITRSAALGVLPNDNGSSLEVTGHDTVPASQGVLVMDADGGYTFTPAADFSGTVTAEYSAEDAEGQETTATLTIVVAPSATDDADATDVNVAITRDASDGVLDNDNGSSLEVTGHDTIPASQGVLVIDADGGYTFTPAADFSGTVTAGYTAEDADGQEVTATLTITVAPSAIDDADSTDVNIAITRGAAEGVLANDNGSSLEVTGHDTIAAGQGTLVIDADGGYTFTPAADFSGTVTVDYTAQDAEGQEVTATLTITVTPSASDDADSTDVNVAITRAAADGVLDNDHGSSLVVTGHDTIPAGQGTLVIDADGGYTFTPAADFSGTVTVDYTAEDAEGQEVTATLTITVTPGASDDADSTDVNIAITRGAAEGVLTNDHGSSLEVSGHDTIAAGQGTLEIDADGGYTFTPAANFSGTVTVQYTAEDAEGQQVTATLTILVGAVAQDDVDTTAVNTAITRDATAGVLINDGGSGLAITGYDTIPAGQGLLTINADGGYTFTPAADFSGTVSAQYFAEDAGGQDISATLTITVTPEANADSGTTPAQTAITWTQADLINDDAGSDLRTVSATNGTNGSVTVNLATGAVTYTPNPGFSGHDTFTYTVEDAEGQAAIATVTVTVTPVATNNADTTTGGTPITRDAANGVIPNDLGGNLRVVAFEAIDSAMGSLVINEDGSYAFTPVQGFMGTVSSIYTVEDQFGQTTTAILTIEVSADLPLVVNTTPRSICVADVPYLDWDLALPAGFPNQGANPLTITFVNPDGDDYVLTGLPLEGTMLWPGASDEDPQQWPGWMQLDDGTYVETEGNFAWTRDNVQVVFSVNPEYTTRIQYPPATSACADVPEGPSESGGGLSETGTDAVKHVPFAAALMVVGGFLLFVARRRRDEDEDAQPQSA